mgnify:CR=1 FL=1
MHDPLLCRLYFILALAGCFSLLPLVNALPELLAATFLFVLWALVLHFLLSVWGGCRLRAVEQAYLWAMLPVGMIRFVWLMTPALNEKWNFLPLMATSVYSAVGILAVWVALNSLTMRMLLSPIVAERFKLVPAIDEAHVAPSPRRSRRMST